LLILERVGWATVRGPSKNEEQIIEDKCWKSKDGEDWAVGDNNKISDDPDDRRENKLGDKNFGTKNFGGASNKFADAIVVVAKGESEDKDNDGDND
jgi:hypothetical protein